MGRLVRAPIEVPASRLRPHGINPGEADLQAGAAGTNGQVERKGGDGYLERVAKYVPAEIVGFFLFVNNILDQAFKAGSSDKPAVMAGMPVSSLGITVFIIALILTPLYVVYQREKGDAWIVHALVSTIAFPVWAYAMHAVAFSGNYDGNFASIVLATFTVASGLIAPRAQKVTNGNGGNNDANDANRGDPDPSPNPNPAPQPDPAAPDPATRSGGQGEPTVLNQPRQQ